MSEPLSSDKSRKYTARCISRGSKKKKNDEVDNNDKDVYIYISHNKASLLFFFGRNKPLGWYPFEPFVFLITLFTFQRFLQNFLDFIAKHLLQ